MISVMIMGAQEYFLQLVLRNGGIAGALEYFGQVGTWKWIDRGCARILKSSRYADIKELRVRQNIEIK